MSDSMTITMRCQFCERLFNGLRPLFTSEQARATCPGCRAEAEENTKQMIDKRRAKGDSK